MPNIYSHYFCGRDALPLMQNETAALAIKYPKAYNIGCQGPDIFFYFRFWPWTKSYGLPDAGRMIHNYNTGAFFEKCLDHIRGLKDEAEKQKAMAYIFGFLCHYSLDTTVHPFIWYFCGRRKYHTLLETHIDSALLLYKGLSIEKLPAYTLLNVSEDEKRVADDLLCHALKSAHGYMLKKGFAVEAISNMRTAVKALHDPKGRKYKFASSLERILDKEAAFTLVVYPPRPPEEYDFLNMQKRIWQPPWGGGESGESYIELLETASSKAAKLCDSAYLAIATDGYDGFGELLGDLSFTTGLDWRLEVEKENGVSIYLKTD